MGSEKKYAGPRIPEEERVLDYYGPKFKAMAQEVERCDSVDAAVDIAKRLAAASEYECIPAHELVDELIVKVLSMTDYAPMCEYVKTAHDNGYYA